MITKSYLNSLKYEVDKLQHLTGEAAKRYHKALRKFHEERHASGDMRINEWEVDDLASVYYEKSSEESYEAWQSLRSAFIEQKNADRLLEVDQKKAAWNALTDEQREAEYERVRIAMNKLAELHGIADGNEE